MNKHSPIVSKLDPIVSEFDTEEAADSYDRWFRAKIEKALANPHPGIPHDEVMAEMRRIIAEKSGKQC